MSQSLTLVPKSLSASTPQGLRRLMLLANAKAGVQHQYRDFYFDPLRRMHVCWYMPLGSDTTEGQLREAEGVLNAE